MPVLTVNGLRHYFRLEGAPNKHRLVMLHPIGADQTLFDKVVPRLLDDFQVLRYDLRGHGGTQSPEDDCTIDSLAQDLCALTEKLGWHEFAACGVSLGGMIALHAAILAPSRISHLTLCSTAAAMSPPPGGWDQRVAIARREGLADLSVSMVERMFSPKYRGTGDPQVDSLQTVFKLTDVEGYARCVAVLRDADLTARLGDVSAPTLVLTGSGDSLITATKVQTLLEGIKGSVHKALPCGHFPPIEAPDEFVAALAESLTSARR